MKADLMQRGFICLEYALNKQYEGIEGDRSNSKGIGGVRRGWGDLEPTEPAQ